MNAPPRIVGFGHLARVGKDTAADMLIRRAGYRRAAFADALKEMALDVFPDLGEKVRVWGWDRVKTTDPGVREMLQRLGVSAREHLGENVWVEAVFSNMDPDGRYVSSDAGSMGARLASYEPVS